MTHLEQKRGAMARVLKALDGKIVFGQKVSILSECGFASTGTGLSIKDQGASPSGAGSSEEARQADMTDTDEPPESSTHPDLSEIDEI